MLSISKDANPNYLAKVVELKGLTKHPNADRLQVCKIDFQDVITGQDAKDGDICVFFPLECQIHNEFLAFTNSFSDSTLNVDTTQKGFFDKKGRVRAVKLRGEKSMGYLVPIHQLACWNGETFGKLEDIVGTEFDTIAGNILCKKYIIPVKEAREPRQGKKPRISRLVDGQVHLHVDTQNLRKEAYKIKPDDHISITYKVHGTSFWVSNVLVKRKLSLMEKILKRFININEQEYDIVYGSRKVVKNEFETQNTNDFYDGDLWSEIKEEIKGSVPKGFTIYGECVGYTKGGAFIQQGYDYGCKVGEHKIYVYRITFTNSDGMVTNLSTQQCQDFCSAQGLEFVKVFFDGESWELLGYEHVNEDMAVYATEFPSRFIKHLEEIYTEKDCFMCTNQVPEEGIVVRKESMFEFEAYKLKSFAFLEYETKMLDSGQEDMES